ncbi:hypothetical protein [Paractinoplanes globisporus]|uniref:Uncharacterized protein n=1 Tax=Paractinoplanes globisporus TaxID=113565 RepID=A0ABW6WFA5_9ACTN|nr:hypothetical protein [Actinoplanes globisporus]
MLVVCGPDTVTLEDPAQNDADLGRRAPELEARAVDEMPGDGQLILPLPTWPTRKKNRFGRRTPWPKLESEDPIEIHPEYE